MIKKDVQKEYLCANIFYIVIHTLRFYTRVKCLKQHVSKLSE